MQSWLCSTLCPGSELLTLLTLGAAALDLALPGDLNRYSIVDPAVGEAARDVVGRHMRYLTPELAVFGLFSDSFSIKDKKDAATKILLHPPNLRKGKPLFLTAIMMKPVYLT